MTDHVRDVIGTATERHMLVLHMDILLRGGQMIDLNDNIDDGGTDYKHVFHDSTPYYIAVYV